jgi:glutamyl-tRNA synthetase
MLRFAPSPTGDMHIGTLRVAIFNYILSKQSDEALIVRIEDIDKEKNIEGKDQEILDILGLFAIEYKEVIYQSNHLKYHRTMALQLLHDKKAFNCFCTPESIEAKKEAAKSAGRAYRYDGSCENLPADMTIDNMNPFVIRLKKPEKALHVKDIIKGEMTYKPDEIESFIIMDKDKYSTYNFACAVDDMISDISMVLRDESHLDDTPKQIAIRNALGYNKEITYAHLPSILNEREFTIKALLEEGYLPEAISNYLISLTCKSPKEIFSVEEASKWFDFSKVLDESITFDISKLRDINRQHLNMLDDKELSRYVGFADEDIGKLAKIYLDGVSTLKELRSKIEPIFASKQIPKDLENDADIVRKVILQAPHFEKFDEFKEYVLNESKIQQQSFLKIIALLLTGDDDTANISKLYAYLKNYIGEIVK